MIHNNFKCCKSKTSEIQDIKPKYNAIFDESLTKIKQKEQELIDYIRKYSKDLQEKINNERSKVNGNLSKIETDVANAKKNFEDQREEIDETLNSRQGSVIFKANMTIKDIKFDSPPDQVKQFIPQTESTKKIQDLFGSLQKLFIPMTDALPNTDFKVIRTFTTSLPFIRRLVKLDETSAWISCDDRRVIRKVNIQDNNMTTSQEIMFNVLDMAATHHNELLLVMQQKSDIKLLHRSGKIVSLISVAPLLTGGIHVTKDKDVMVGVWDGGDPYKPTDRSTRAVLVYNMQGKQKQKYHNNKDGKRLFTLPNSITTNRNQDIIIVDSTSDDTGRLVVLNKEGNLRWFYEGNSSINASQKFNPRNIVTISVGHFVVSDFSSHALHVLSEDGEVLTCKVMIDIGIEYPLGLDIDKEERLWLGCGTGGKETGAKLHIIKLV